MHLPAQLRPETEIEEWEIARDDASWVYEKIEKEDDKLYKKPAEKLEWSSKIVSEY